MSEEGSLTLHVVHGRQKHRLDVKRSSSIQQVSEELESLTGVLARQQKLIHKSKILQQSLLVKDTTLQAGDSIMLLGTGGQTQVRVRAQAGALCWPLWPDSMWCCRAKQLPLHIQLTSRHKKQPPSLLSSFRSRLPTCRWLLMSCTVQLRFEGKACFETLLCSC